MKVHDCEQRSDEWYELRLGLPTASNFNSLITPTGKVSTAGALTYAASLAAETYAKERLDVFEGNDWTERGREIEDQARDLYSLLTNEQITTPGFVTTDDGQYGCSPDGLIGSDGMMEIKCLKAENHVKCLAHIAEHNTCPKDYMSQVQGQLLVADRDWCDVTFFHPQLPFKVVRQHRDWKRIDALKEALVYIIETRDDMVIVLRDAVK